MSRDDEYDYLFKGKEKKKREHSEGDFKEIALSYFSVFIFSPPLITITFLYSCPYWRFR